jgi:predicted RNase H-like HicB family nuclease
MNLAGGAGIGVSYEASCKDVENNTMKIEIEREDDGRWIAEVPDLPGVMIYAKTREEAIVTVQSFALRVIADRLDHGETIPELNELFALPA